MLIALSLCLSTFVYGQTSMDEVAAKWSDGSYASRNNNSGMWEPMASGKSDIKFEKGANGKVASIIIGSDTYPADVTTGSSFVVYFRKGSERLYLTETSIIFYEQFSGDPNPKKFWGKKPGGIGSVAKEIKEYGEKSQVIIKTQLEESSKLAAEKAEKERVERLKKYSLEGKDVVKIEVINIKVPEKFGHFRGFTFDVMATLKDGSKISTEGFSQGYISDYTITYSAANYSAGSINSGFVLGDKIKVTATSKFNPKNTDSKDVTLLYNEDISFNYNGTTWSRSAGIGANSYRIEVKQVKHAVNATAVLMIRIFDTNSSTMISEFKMASTQTLKFYAKGGNGGTDDGKGFNGGNGGNITVIKDPSVKEFNISYEIFGGRGGAGHNSSLSGRDGRDGRDGAYKEEVRAVKM